MPGDSNVKRLRWFELVFLFAIGAGLSAVCQTQQNTSCQPQDYANVGAEIADTAVKIEGTASDSGLSQDAVQSIVAGYTAKRVQLAATNCNASASTTNQATAQPITPVATNAPAPTQQPPANKSKTKGAVLPTAAAAAINNPKCPGAPVFESEPKPTLGAIEPGVNVVAHGVLPKGTKGQVQVCVNGQPAGGLAKLDSLGNFTVGLDDVTAGEVVVAQLINPVAPNASTTYGPLSEGVIVGNTAIVASPPGSMAKCPGEPIISTDAQCG